MILNEGFDLLIEELLEENAKNDFITKFGEDTFNKFEKAKQRLKNNNLSTDYQQYLNMSKEELLKLLSNQYDTNKEKDLQKLRQNQDVGTEIRGNYNYLGEAKGYKVYQPLDYLASMDLGVNSGWCTTGRYEHAGEGASFVPSAKDAKKHFEEYTDQGVKLYYFLDPDTMFGEYAIAVYPQPVEIDDIVDVGEDEYLSDIIGDSFTECVVNYEIFDENDDHAYAAVDKLPVELIPEKLIFRKPDRKNGLITIDNTLTGISIDFKGDELIIPDNITEINIKACYLTHKLQKVVIPASIVKIESMSNLQSHIVGQIIVDPNNKVYDSRNDCNAVIKTATNTLVAGCKNTIIPDTVKVIGLSALSHCDGLTQIIIPDGVEEIENFAFACDYNLKEIVIPATVKKLGSYAFQYCRELTKVKFLGTDVLLGDAVFSNCNSLQDVSLPSELRFLPSWVFEGCTSLKDLKLPEDVMSLHSHLFEDAVIDKLYIPSSVKQIAPGVFNQGHINSVEVDKNNTVYDSRDNCNAVIETDTDKLIATCQNSIIPNGVKIIGTGAFEGARNRKIVIPDSVTTIEGYAFFNCKNVTVIVPDSVIELLPEPAGVFRTTGTSKTLNVFGVLDSRQNSILPPITVQTNNQMIIDYCEDNNIDWLPLY